MQEANWELILHRLDDLTKNQVEFNSKLDTIHEQLNRVNQIEVTVSEFQAWKTRMQDSASVSEIKDIKVWKGKQEEMISLKQFETLLVEHEKLKTFKTQATMIWVVVQVIMTLVMFWQKIF